MPDLLRVQQQAADRQLQGLLYCDLETVEFQWLATQHGHTLQYDLR